MPKYEYSMDINGIIKHDGKLTTIYRRSECEKDIKTGSYGRQQLSLISENDPQSYVEMYENGELQAFVKQFQSEYAEMESNITKQWMERNPDMSETQARMMAQEFLRYDS